MLNSFVYPKLPAKFNLGIVRIGGYGLANCLFVYGRAIIVAHEDNKTLFSGTWINFSIGPYLRFELDKRHYSGIFKFEILQELKKIIYILFYKDNITIVSGLGAYFEELKQRSDIIKTTIWDNLTVELKLKLKDLNSQVIGIHIRLGDYPQNRRTNLNWYIEIVKLLSKLDEYLNFDFLVFSDGTIEELNPILSLARVKLYNSGNAFIDLWTLSQSKLIIGSDSTFSAWASYLNQVPIILYSRHFGSILDNPLHEIVIEDNIGLVLPFVKRLTSEVI